MGGLQHKRHNGAAALQFFVGGIGHQCAAFSAGADDEHFIARLNKGIGFRGRARLVQRGDHGFVWKIRGHFNQGGVGKQNALPLHCQVGVLKIHRQDAVQPHGCDRQGSQGDDFISYLQAVVVFVLRIHF